MFFPDFFGVIFQRNERITIIRETLVEISTIFFFSEYFYTTVYGFVIQYLGNFLYVQYVHYEMC